MVDLFHYFCGTPVRVGDRVKYSKWDCVIHYVFAPGTQDAADFSCPLTGGVMLSIIEGDKLNTFLLMEPPDREQWEDLEFIERGTHPV